MKPNNLRRLSIINSGQFGESELSHKIRTNSNQINTMTKQQEFVEITCQFGKNKGKTFKCIPTEFQEDLWVMDINGNPYIFTGLSTNASLVNRIGEFAYGLYKTGKDFEYGWGSLGGRIFYKPV